MEFRYTQKREFSSYAQRSVAMAPQGMVASSHQLATLAGYRILSKGGNAVDAAVAMVSTLSVVEPQSVGIGGDAFALIYLADQRKVVGMNASGKAPYRANISWFLDQGMKAMPERGILSVTVPGALHGWAQALERYGTLELTDVFEDAIHYAENGFPVTEVIAGEWKSVEQLLLSHESSSKSYLLDGRSPKPGEVFINRDMGRTYRKIVQDGIEAFYEGEICRAIVDFSRKNDGLLSVEDLETHTTTWVEPISTTYRGYTILELPPNGQGVTALEMLNILEGYDVESLGHNSPEYLHLLIEAKKIAFSDRDHFVTDPEFEDVPVTKFLSEEYAKQCRGRIAIDRAMTPPIPTLSTQGSDTVYVTAVDQHRNAVSFISSIYTGFGSGMVVDGTGIVLHNRGKSFSLDAKHPNRLEPNKRPMHTIIPGMVFKDGDFLMSFGVMMEVYLEDGISSQTARLLHEKGHQILQTAPPVNEAGGGQAVYLDQGQNVLLGTSDRRKDGCAIGY